MKVRITVAWRVVLLTVSLATSSASVQAGEYESAFGFGISVPEVWLVLTREQILDSAEHLMNEETDRDSVSGFASVPRAMRQAVNERVQAGELEMYYRRGDRPGAFVDNVNVMQQVAELPSTQAQLVGICRALPTEFSRIFGRPIGMDVCEMRERVGRRALYLQFDGAVPGTTTLHYQLQRDSGRTLVFTATTTLASLAEVTSEFEGMIASIRLR
jgi:hypothetical protein